MHTYLHKVGVRSAYTLHSILPRSHILGFTGCIVVVVVLNKYASEIQMKLLCSVWTVIDLEVLWAFSFYNPCSEISAFISLFLFLQHLLYVELLRNFSMYIQL